LCFCLGFRHTGGFEFFKVSESVKSGTGHTRTPVPKNNSERAFWQCVLEFVSVDEAAEGWQQCTHGVPSANVSIIANKSENLAWL